MHEEKIKKPPLGVKPFHLVMEEYIHNVNEALYRALEARDYAHAIHLNNLLIKYTEWKEISYNLWKEQQDGSLPKPTGFKILTYDTIQGYNGEREYLSKFATSINVVHDFHNKPFIIMVVPRGIDETVDKIIREKE